MRIIEPVEFKRAFVKTLGPKEPILLKKWDGRLSEYTALIRSCLPGIATALNLEIYNGDYYTLDAVFYETRDIVHFDKTTTYVHYIVIALEHENNISGAYGEVNKLQLINTPLKVLVTYAPEQQHAEYLDEYSQMIGAADVFQDVSSHRKQLVILGDKVQRKILWLFYQYHDGRFEKV